jgi:histidine phosphotransferase ChpT
MASIRIPHMVPALAPAMARDTVMNLSTRTQLAQLICTRLCHDLAGPVGAVSAGVELLGDDPAMIDRETLDLIAASSAAASKKLKFMRVIFGTVTQHSPAALADLESTVDGFLSAIAGSSGPAKIQWPTPALLSELQAKASAAAIQVLLNAVLVVLEAQPGATSLEVEIDPTKEIVIRARGRANHRRDIFEAVAEPEHVLPSARNAQALYWVTLVQDLGTTPVLTAAEGAVTATIPLPQR